MKAAIWTMVAAASVAACDGGDAVPHREREPEGPALTVVVESLPITVPVQGTVHGVQRAVLSTRLMARVTDVLVEVGAEVSEGQVLVRLGGDDVAANRAKAEAAQRVARAAHAEAERHAARMDTLYGQDAVARVQRDQAHLQLTQAAAQVAVAEATVAEVETARRYATIRAPFAGVVVRRAIDVGATATPGQPLIELEGVGGREAILGVPADVAARLEVGDEVVVSARGGLRAAGPVRAVAGGADPHSRTVEVRVDVPATWPTGVAVTALVPDGQREAIAVPEDAVVRRGQLTGVRVHTPHGPTLRWIRLGRTIEDERGRRVEVLSGLTAGERIAL